jgi:hypothetical protein
VDGCHSGPFLTPPHSHHSASPAHVFNQVDRTSEGNDCPRAELGPNYRPLVPTAGSGIPGSLAMLALDSRVRVTSAGGSRPSSLFEAIVPLLPGHFISTSQDKSTCNSTIVSRKDILIRSPLLLFSASGEPDFPHLEGPPMTLDLLPLRPGTASAGADFPRRAPDETPGVRAKLRHNQGAIRSTHAICDGKHMTARHSGLGRGRTMASAFGTKTALAARSIKIPTGRTR